ncbi:MAG TPA: tail fiber protein [Pyrinomonadaceae bacterium]|nr:tail fiber protein [Pyrinomonadaceae bacterium]
MPTQPYLGDIFPCAFDFPPKGWAFCNGQLLQISQHNALFSLLGTTYGGDGKTTFALPDLRGRVPVGAGQTLKRGQTGGEEKHTLTVDELARHTHSFYASGAAADQSSPVNNFCAGGAGNSSFASTHDTQLASSAVSNFGSNQPHENMPPYFVLNYIIALQGIFPSVDYSEEKK